MTVVLDTRDDFTLANFRRVCYGGEAVRLGEQARRALAAAAWGRTAPGEAGAAAEGTARALAALASPCADRPHPAPVSARRACSPSRTASPP